MGKLDKHTFIYGHRYTDLSQSGRKHFEARERPRFNKYSQTPKSDYFSNSFDGIILKIGTITAIVTLAVIISLII
jgi:hypothetical protein